MSLPNELREFFETAGGGNFTAIGRAIADMLDRDTPTDGTEYTRLLSEALDRFKRAARIIARRSDA